MASHVPARKPRVMFICGSRNQTSQMHQIYQALEGQIEGYFSYHWTSHPLLRFLAYRLGLVQNIVPGKGRFRRMTLEYLAEHDLPADHEMRQHGPYDLVFTCADIIWQRELNGLPVVMVQEGLPDQHGWLTPIVKALGLPRYLAFNVSLYGTSAEYDRFCVASEGMKRYYHQWGGVPAEKLVVTGIPNFDNLAAAYNNPLPDRDYVLVCTSDLRETLRPDDRATFFAKVKAIADGRPVKVKLHPNEQVDRATREVNQHLPGAEVLTTGNVDHLIANCAVLITQFSTLTLNGLVLGKEVHSYLDVQKLQAILPVQNGGTSAQAIAQVGLSLLQRSRATPSPMPQSTPEALTA